MSSPIEIDPESLERETRQGFSVRDRMKGRGLRKATITIFTDEELDGLGDARDAFGPGGAFLGRVREGILGEIDALEENKREAVAKAHDKIIKAAGLKFAKDNADDMLAVFDPDEVELPEVPTPDIDAKIAALAIKRDEMIAELTKTALVISMKAIPPVIQDGARIKAKRALKKRNANKDDEDWQDLDKEDKDQWFENAYTAYMMTDIFQSVTDNATGAVNTTTTFEDAMDYIGLLPPSQFSRLDVEMGKLQLKDAISRTIEVQQDFS